MKRVGFWLAAAVVLLCSGTLYAFAEEGIALKPLAPGTVFNFNTKDGPTKVTIMKMEGISIFQEQARMTTVTNESIGFGVSLRGNQPDRMDEANRVLVTKLFPLKVGNRTRFEFKGTAKGQYEWTATVKMEVTGMTKVTVPAGTFDAIVIETSTQSDGYRAFNTCWYAPDVGYCAKREFRSSRENFDWDLMSVTLPTTQ
jgi:hypothetical protein